MLRALAKAAYFKRLAVGRQLHVAATAHLHRMHTEHGAVINMTYCSDLGGNCQSGRAEGWVGGDAVGHYTYVYHTGVHHTGVHHTGVHRTGVHHTSVQGRQCSCSQTRVVP